MRALFASLVLVAAALALGDVSIDARRSTPAPHSPLGPRCDAALAAAQARFADGSGIDFHVRQWRVLGEYSWSDMCGVWGNYAVELVPDDGPAHRWRWHDRGRDADGDRPVHHQGTRRARGWRATLTIDGDSDGGPADYFVETFRPAIDACLDDGR